MGTFNPTTRAITDKIRSDIIGQYRRGNDIWVISKRVGIDQYRCLAVILDYILDVEDANKEKEM